MQLMLVIMVLVMLSEVAQEIGLTLDDIQKIRKLWVNTTSLDITIGREEDGFTIADTIIDTSIPTPEVAVSRIAMKEQLALVMESLTPREREVITMRYGLDGEHVCTLDEIGRHYQLSRERIRQVEKQALKKLRNPTRLRKLQCLLDA